MKVLFTTMVGIWCCGLLLNGCSNNENHVLYTVTCNNHIYHHVGRSGRLGDMDQYKGKTIIFPDSCIYQEE